MQTSELEAQCLDLAIRVLEGARAKGLTIGTAESCTGGLIASLLTSVPGSSDSFIGSVVSYWVSAKERILHVPTSIIEEHGVVSEQCASAMAQGARAALQCDIAISTTGIAGPSGALPGKPVGTVCFGIATPDEINAFTTCKGHTRDEVRLIAVRTALSRLLDALEDHV